MASLRPSFLTRPILKKDGTRLFSNPQRRWARVYDVRFVTTQPPSERVFDKYREKLDRKAKELGVKDAEELKRVYREKSRASSQPSSTTPPPIPPPYTVPPPPSAASTAGPSPPAAPRSTSSAPPGVKTLSSFIDMDKFHELPEKEIATLWRLRHASSPHSLCAIIPYPVYQRMEATARRHPQFILPISRSDPDAESKATEGSTSSSSGAADIHFLQWNFPTPTSATVLFTHLAEYKARGEYAVPHTTVTHHLELAADKGLVLLQGTVADDRGVGAKDAHALLLTLQRFYALEAERPERGRLLEQFSRGDAAFRVEALVEEAEKVW